MPGLDTVEVCIDLEDSGRSLSGFLPDYFRILFCTAYNQFPAHDPPNSMNPCQTPPFGRWS